MRWDYKCDRYTTGQAGACAQYTGGVGGGAGAASRRPPYVFITGPRNNENTFLVKVPSDIWIFSTCVSENFLRI